MTCRVFATRPLYALTITGTQSNVNVRTSLSSPSIAGDVLVTITSTGICNSTSGSPALRLGTGWPAGCTFKVSIAGSVRGSSGVGGVGGTPGLGANGSPGTAGNNAMDLDGNTVAVDLGTTGQLFGGGGGGGGGAACNSINGAGGGGGGGGQGDVGSGSGGAAGGGTNPGNAGNAGNSSGAGVGGSGGVDGAFSGGGGGYGGGWGDAGTSGASATPGGTGGSPGAGGKAINLNGGSVTWIAGNNATQVRGAVS